MENKTMAKSSWLAAFTVASVWFGTHVGGGFASGNQVVNYFAQYGWTAAIFPIFAMGILAVVTYIILKFAKLNGFDNYKDTFSALYPTPKMEFLFEIFYIVIILAAVAAAVAGAGEVVANFLGFAYVGTSKLLCNLAIVAILVVLTIFGIKLVVAASTVLSVAILVITAIIVVTGLSSDIDAYTATYVAEHSIEAVAYTDAMGTAIWRGVIVYAGFQCVSIPAMIAAAPALNFRGIKRASILGWLMNGGALAASGFMLSKWYPLLQGLQNAGIEGFTKAATGIPNQTVLTILGIKWMLAVFSVLLFCAFVSTCVTLIFSMVQRFQSKLFPNTIKSEKVRSVIVGVIVIAICFGLSMMGLSWIITYAYGYDGYYALAVVVLPAFIWGIPKIKKLQAEKSAAELE